VRIALVSPYSWSVPGGVNQHIEHLAEELGARGHEPWILAPVGALTPRRRGMESRRHRAAERFIPMGTSIPLPSNGSRAYLNFNPRVALRMDRAVRAMRFDLMHVHEPFTPSVAMTAVILSTSPIVGTFHAALDASRWYTNMELIVKALMRRVDVRVAVSPAAMEYPARMFPGDWRIIPNGITVEKFSPALGTAKVKGKVLFIGRAEPRKGLGVLLPAFAQLRRRRPDATLVIAGANRQQTLEAVRRAQGSRDGQGLRVDLTGVEPLGWVDDDEKVRQLGEAQVVCAPSLTAESFGIVLAEAMAAGVPVVASDLPGYRAVLQDGVCGRLVTPDRPDLLAGALEEVLDDAALRERLTAAGLRAAQKLSWSSVTDEILKAYQDALAVGDRPGIHGLRDRPWFGRALVEYTVTKGRAGRDAEGRPKWS
jgi:phosphatidylinositol alpha-mannosyltransferase